MSRFGLGFIGSGGVPGNDSFTKILLHMDGSNGGTTFTDLNAGGSAHTWAPTNATTSTAASKFGGASMLTAAGCITTPDHADFTLGSGDFTVDLWVNFNGTSGAQYLYGQSDSLGNVASESLYLMRTASGTLNATFVTSGFIFIPSTTTNFNGSSTWTHLAVVRNGSGVRLYVNGVQDGSTLSIGTVQDGSGTWAVGSRGAQSGSRSSCYIDEFRLSVGIARWTSSFVPPVGPYI